MSDCIICSGDLLLHIHKNQLHWYCDHCREQFPYDLPTRYHRFTVNQPKPLMIQRSLKIPKYLKSKTRKKKVPKTEEISVRSATQQTS